MILTQIYQIISVIEIYYFMLPLCMLNWQSVLVYGNYRPANSLAFFRQSLYALHKMLHVRGYKQVS